MNNKIFTKTENIWSIDMVMICNPVFTITWLRKIVIFCALVKKYVIEGKPIERRCLIHAQHIVICKLTWTVHVHPTPSYKLLMETSAVCGKKLDWIKVCFYVFFPVRNMKLHTVGGRSISGWGRGGGGGGA